MIMFWLNIPGLVAQLQNILTVSDYSVETDLADLDLALPFGKPTYK